MILPHQWHHASSPCVEMTKRNAHGIELLQTISWIHPSSVGNSAQTRVNIAHSQYVPTSGILRCWGQICTHRNCPRKQRSRDAFCGQSVGRRGFCVLVRRGCVFNSTEFIGGNHHRRTRSIHCVHCTRMLLEGFSHWCRCGSFLTPASKIVDASVKSLYQKSVVAAKETLDAGKNCRSGINVKTSFPNEPTLSSIGHEDRFLRKSFHTATS